MNTEPDDKDSSHADFMEHIRNEAQEAYNHKSKKNIQFTAWFTIIGFVVAALWGYLFYQADTTKMQIFWGLALLGELLGIGILGLMFTQIDVQLIMQREHRRIESQLLDLHERLMSMQGEQKDESAE